MEKISVAIITNNEQDNIRRCLESVTWADEIVVVDSGSTDRTLDICKEFGARTISQEWLGYVGQKNHAAKLATHDWILSLDADEVVSPQLLTSIQELQRNGLTKSGYLMPRRVLYLGKWINHSGWYPDRKLRLFDRRKGTWTGRKIHEIVRVDGECGLLQGDLLHYSYRDVTAHARQINNFTSIAAAEMSEKGKNSGILKILLSPIIKFVKTYFVKRGFLDGRVGLVIAMMGSYYVFLKYLKRWELQLQEQRESTSR